MAPPRSSGFTDPGWEHGVSQDDKKKKVKCNYCGKIVSGGIYRLKQHLARISGEVTFCRKAPEDVCAKMKENLAGSQAIKKHRRHNEDDENDDHASFDLHSNDDNEDVDEHGDFKEGEKLGEAPLRSLGYVDPGWEHGVAQDSRKKKVKCNYCEKIVSGGINRFKQHLARIPGEVASCKMAPDEVYLKMKENMKWHRTGRRRLAESELTSFFDESDRDETRDEFANSGSKVSHFFGDQLLVPYTGRRRRRSGGGDRAAKHVKLDNLSLAKSPETEIEKKSREAISAVAKFFYHAGIPLNAARSPYFHQMLDLVSQCGPGWRSPSSQLLSDQLLQEEVASIKQHQLEMRTSWMVTGCTIMAVRWNDVEDRMVINFLVSCPRGTSFVSSVAASDIAEDPPGVFKLLDGIVEEVGEENVVQVVTESSPAFRAAGRMLEEKRRNLFWTPCAAYSIDRVLEDFIKIKFVEECMTKAQKVTRLIYNHSWLLNLMKEFTAGKELLQLASTKSASFFLSLHCLLDYRNALKRVFQSSKWVESRLADTDEGKEVQSIVLGFALWKKIQYVRRSVEPILQVLLKVEDNRRPSLPFIYDDMHRAKLSVKEIHGGDERKCGPFLAAMDNHLNPLFHHPIYAAAYFLNPSFRYRADFRPLPEVIRGVNECIVRMELDGGRRISASMQIADFVSAKDDFGTELAVSTRTELDPGVWWQQHGMNCPELQRIAVRVLSQGGGGCRDHAAGMVHAHRGRNRLAQKLRSDVLFVHFNLRLQDRQLAGPDAAGPAFLDHLLAAWLSDPAAPPPPHFPAEEEMGMYEAAAAAAEGDAAEGEENAADLSGAPFPEIVEPLDFQHGVECGGATDDDDDAAAAAAADDDGDADIDFFGDG